jgi:hypothetical protein
VTIAHVHYPTSLKYQNSGVERWGSTRCVPAHHESLANDMLEEPVRLGSPPSAILSSFFFFFFLSFFVDLGVD